MQRLKHIFVPLSTAKSTHLFRPWCDDLSMANSRNNSQKVVAANLAAIIKHRCLTVPAAAAMLRVKPYQLRRLLAASHSPTTRTLDEIAETFDLEPYQLLVPGLDPSDPQILRVLSPVERVIYKALEESRKTAE